MDRGMASSASVVNDPKADIGRVDIPQRSSLLP
jgi:hypothetical protein